MTTGKALFALLVTLAVGILLPSLAYAFPSEGFSQREEDIFDEWGISRTRHKQVDGFLGLTATDMSPIVVNESLGENADLAWQLGEEFALKYPDRHQRAEQIFYFVRDRVDYASDRDQFGLDEFAMNADEVAEAILDGVAEGDCEDMSALLAVMYKAAGYRSAIALMTGHVAILVYLPEYRRATRMISVAGEDGWVWAEATMDTNPLGWVPESVASRGLIVSEVITSPLQRQEAFTTQLRDPEDGPLASTVQRGLPRRSATTRLMKEFVVLVSAVGLLLAIVGGWSLAYRFGKRS